MNAPISPETLKTVLEKHLLWLDDKPGGECADLENANLKNADLRNADLRNANLENADLRNANLRYANLRNANLRNANLRYANLENANLENANLEDANLRYANLENANLEDANLRYANLDHTCLRNATINWNSHDLISEILKRSAKTTNQFMIVGLILIKWDWCWNHFYEEIVDPETRNWIQTTLNMYVKEGDGHPVYISNKPITTL